MNFWKWNVDITFFQAQFNGRNRSVQEHISAAAIIASRREQVKTTWCVVCGQIIAWCDNVTWDKRQITQPTKISWDYPFKYYRERTPKTEAMMLPMTTAPTPRRTTPMKMVKTGCQKEGVYRIKIYNRDYKRRLRDQPKKGNREMLFWH